MELRVVNYILHDERELLFDSLSDEEKKNYAEALQVRAMEAVGYQKKQSSVTAAKD